MQRHPGPTVAEPEGDQPVVLYLDGKRIGEFPSDTFPLSATNSERGYGSDQGFGMNMYEWLKRTTTEKYQQVVLEDAEGSVLNASLMPKETRWFLASTRKERVAVFALGLAVGPGRKSGGGGGGGGGQHARGPEPLVRNLAAIHLFSRPAAPTQNPWNMPTDRAGTIGATGSHR